MKRIYWLVLCNLTAASVAFLSLYCYKQNMTMYSLILAGLLLLEIGLRAILEDKFLKEEPEIREQKIYRITKILRGICEMILIAGVLMIRLK